MQERPASSRHLWVCEVWQALPLALHSVPGSRQSLLQVCQLLLERLPLLHQLSSLLRLQFALQAAAFTNASAQPLQPAEAGTCLHRSSIAVPVAAKAAGVVLKLPPSIVELEGPAAMGAGRSQWQACSLLPARARVLPVRVCAAVARPYVLLVLLQVSAQGLHPCHI